jgi:hypothetical protein
MESKCTWHVDVPINSSKRLLVDVRPNVSDRLVVNRYLFG